MEPMQRERARPASGIGSDDRRSFRGDYSEQEVQLVARGAITNEAVGDRCNPTVLCLVIGHFRSPDRPCPGHVAIPARFMTDGPTG